MHLIKINFLRVFSSILVILAFSVVCRIIVTLFLSNEFANILANANQSRKNAGEFCNREKAIYSVVSTRRSTELHARDEFVIKGRKFDCASIKYLKKFRLRDEDFIHYSVMPSDFPSDIVFVLAADISFYNSLRAAIVSIQTMFQGNYRKIVVYDLGGISDNYTMVNDLKSACKTELKLFNFDEYPPHVRILKTFAWKILIMAELFREFNTFIYCDTSIHFLTNDYRDFFTLWRKRRLHGVQFSKSAHHGVRFATSPKMLQYIPLNSDFVEDIEMHEANMIFITRGHWTRVILKWATLCALERECIDPIGSSIACYVELEGTAGDGHCHRQDQSVLSILVNNFELDARRRGDTVLIPHQSYYHPSKLYERHLLLRGQITERQMIPCRDAPMAIIQELPYLANQLMRFYNNFTYKHFRFIKPIIQQRRLAQVCLSILQED